MSDSESVSTDSLFIHHRRVPMLACLRGSRLEPSTELTLVLILKLNCRIHSMAIRRLEQEVAELEDALKLAMQDYGNPDFFQDILLEEMIYPLLGLPIPEHPVFIVGRIYIEAVERLNALHELRESGRQARASILAAAPPSAISPREPITPARPTDQLPRRPHRLLDARITSARRLGADTQTNITISPTQPRQRSRSRASVGVQRTADDNMPRPGMRRMRN